MIDRERANRTSWWKVLFWVFAMSFGAQIIGASLSRGVLILPFSQLGGSILVAIVAAGIWWVFWGRRR